MQIAKTKHGSIIYGRVVKIKPGVGAASDSLTIVTLAKVDYRGRETGVQVKVLFWNSTKQEWNRLSDRARQLTIGSIITARVGFDIGDVNKATGFDFKKQGLYKFINDEEQEEVVICGKVMKTTSSNNYFGAYVPLNRPNEKGEFETEWFVVNFFDKAAESQSKFIAKGDMVFAKGILKRIDNNGRMMTYINPRFIKSVANI